MALTGQIYVAPHARLCFIERSGGEGRGEKGARCLELKTFADILINLLLLLLLPVSMTRL